MAKDTTIGSGPLEQATEALAGTLQGMRARASEALRDATFTARETVEDAGDRVASIEDALEEITSEHPKAMLGIAVVAGFLLGALYWGARRD